MNKADLIEAVAPRVGGRAVATLAVESLVDLILREVAAGGSVVVTGFGTFEKVDRAARTGRNPRTGEAVPIEATSSPRFRPAAYFKDVVGDPSRLPKDGLAGVRVGSDGTAPVNEGAPPSVRRSSEQDSARPSGQETVAKKASARRRTATGTPTTVRAEAAVPQILVETAEAAPAAGGGLVAGGEEITMGMINAKKAQLARVKTDEVAKKAKDDKAKDHRAKDDKAKDGRAKDGRAKAGKKGKKDKDGKGKKSRKG